jgi:hypothetical protein
MTTLALLCATGFIAWYALRIVRVLRAPYKSLYREWPSVEKLTGQPWHLGSKGPGK